jgi:hypothetical protein
LCTAYAVPRGVLPCTKQTMACVRATKRTFSAATASLAARSYCCVPAMALLSKAAEAAAVAVARAGSPGFASTQARAPRLGEAAPPAMLQPTAAAAPGVTAHDGGREAARSARRISAYCEWVSSPCNTSHRQQALDAGARRERWCGGRNMTKPQRIDHNVAHN